MGPNHRSTLLGRLLVLLLLSAPVAARAQSSTDKATAEALFQAGRDLMGAGKFAEACSKFEASQRLDAGLGTLLYLADCYEKANRLASAWATFREAESIAMGRADQARAQVAKDRAASIEPRLSRLQVDVGADHAALLKLERDGETIPPESWGLPLPVDEGQHRISASAPGRKPWSTVVDVQGAAVTVPVAVPPLEAAPVEAAPPPTTPPTGAAPPPRDPGTGSRGSMQRAIGIGIGVAGVVSVGVGGLFGLRARSKNKESLDHCRDTNPNLCTQEGVDLRDDALAAASMSTAFMIAGGALVAGGVVVYLTAPSSASSAARSLHLATAPTRGGANFSLGGTF